MLPLRPAYFDFYLLISSGDTNSGNKNGGSRTADCITYSIQGSKTAVTSVNSSPQPAPPAPGTASVELGQLNCATSTIPANDAAFWMTLEEVKDAINTFCTTRDKGVSFKSDRGTPLQSSVTAGDHPIRVSATWRPNDSCKTLSPLDFGKAEAVETCKSRLGVILNSCESTVYGVIVYWDECVMAYEANTVCTGNPSAGGNKYWKAGGSFFRDCIAWDVRRASDKAT